ncbi:MAG: strictosidine synthase [Monoraphidium minutum]|nr:MAG: strictosidine synthase [Monoraphidium minutum]
MAAFFIATTLSTLAIMALITGIELGLVPISLPVPPARRGEMMQAPPPGLVPVVYDDAFDPNSTDLRAAARHFAGDDRIAGVETVAVAPNGTLALINKFGEVFLADPQGAGAYSAPRLAARIAPGRSLGAKFDAAGHLLVCNGPLGLVMISGGAGAPPRQALLTARVSDDSPLAAGRPIEFANSLDIASDGRVYFSHSTDLAPFRMPDGTWNPLDSVFVSLGQSAPSGMLLRYDPASRRTAALAAGLWYANGVALSAGEDFVLVADSLQAKVFRHWLQGPRAGATEPFIENLPGPPDGVTRAADGGFWVTIFTHFPGVMKFSASRLMRAAMTWCPPALRPKLQPMGLVLKLSPAGDYEFSLADPGGSMVAGVTSAVEGVGGELWLGGLHARGAAALDLAAALRGKARGGGAAGAAAAALLGRIDAAAAAAAELAAAAAAGGEEVQQQGAGGAQEAEGSGEDRSEL